MKKEIELIWMILLSALIITALCFISCIGLSHKVDELNNKIQTLHPNKIVIEAAQTEEPDTNPLANCIIPLGTFKITHYCPCTKCCGPHASGITASGLPATEGQTIAMEGLPIGSVIYIEELGEVRVVEDRFGDTSLTDRVDIYVESHEKALQRGTYFSKIYLISKGD